MNNILSALEGMTGVTIHEYRMVTPAVAKITATVVGNMTKDECVEAITSSLNNRASVIRDSFRFLDNKTMVGFVHASREVRVYDNEVKAKFKAIASNMFMDKEDESLWEMREGAGGKYLARHGHDDLSSLLEVSRSSPRGSTPRLSAVTSSSVDVTNMVAYVAAGRWSADVDYGFCIGQNNDGTYRVIGQDMEVAAVNPEMVVASYEVDKSSLPKIPKSAVRASNDPLAGNYPLSGKELSWEEYYKLAYAYAPEYADKVIEQIRQMSAV